MGHGGGRSPTAWVGACRRACNAGAVVGRQYLRRAAVAATDKISSQPVTARLGSTFTESAVSRMCRRQQTLQRDSNRCVNLTSHQKIQSTRNARMNFLFNE
jgi:hypothetical protein